MSGDMYMKEMICSHGKIDMTHTNMMLDGDTEMIKHNDVEEGQLGLPQAYLEHGR